MSASLRPRLPIGELFVIGFPGERPPSPWWSFVRDERIGGVIYFEESCRDHQEFRRLTEEVREMVRPRTTLAAIDQEGGRVCRLKGAPAEYRAAAEYGRTNDLLHFAEEYRRSTGYLESLGINCNLAPVADLELVKDNPALIGRTFGDDPHEISPYITRSIEVAHESGILACVKHFPGLGAAKIDPHVAVSRASYDFEDWRHREAIPFRAAIAAQVDLVMTTHLILEKVDSRPATVSNVYVKEWLRKSLGYEGAVVTDDLTMQGAEDAGTVGERTVEAFLAGHDVLLFGREFERAMEAYDYFIDCYERGEIDPALVRHSLQRIAGLKYKLDRVSSRA